jgi:hypothetical protein
VSRERALTACLAALIASTGAGAAFGGYERRASTIATDLAGRAVTIVCEDARGWRDRARAAAFDPAATWATTPFRWDAASRAVVPTGESAFSPRACDYGRLFTRGPALRGARLCEYRQTAGGRLRVAVWAECGDWEPKMLAVHVLTHESVHLAGEPDEAVADCLAAQLDAYVAIRLGASERFARLLADELWRGYVRKRASAAPGCRDEGKLDLFEGIPGWPTPVRPLAGAAARRAVPAALAAHSPTG